MLKKVGINNLFYFSDIANFSNIVSQGILAKNNINQKNISYNSFANENVQNRRQQKNILLSNGKMANVHDCVPLYMRHLSPTQCACRSKEHNFVFFVFDSNIILDKNKNFAFTDGNAGSRNTKFYNNLAFIDKIPVETINNRYWHKQVDGRRKAQSEVLIYNKLDIKEVKYIVVYDIIAKLRVEKELKENGLNIKVKIKENFYFNSKKTVSNTSEYIYDFNLF